MTIANSTSATDLRSSALALSGKLYDQYRAEQRQHPDRAMQRLAVGDYPVAVLSHILEDPAEFGWSFEMSKGEQARTTLMARRLTPQERDLRDARDLATKIVAEFRKLQDEFPGQSVRMVPLDSKTTEGVLAQLGTALQECSFELVQVWRDDMQRIAGVSVSFKSGLRLVH